MFARVLHFLACVLRSVATALDNAGCIGQLADSIHARALEISRLELTKNITPMKPEVTNAISKLRAAHVFLVMLAALLPKVTEELKTLREKVKGPHDDKEADKKRIDALTAELDEANAALASFTEVAEQVHTATTTLDEEDEGIKAEAPTDPLPGDAGTGDANADAGTPPADGTGAAGNADGGTDGGTVPADTSGNGQGG